VALLNSVRHPKLLCRANHGSSVIKAIEETHILVPQSEKAFQAIFGKVAAKI